MFVNGQGYTGDGRRFVEGAMYSAARAALKVLRLPYEICYSNKMIQDVLDQHCQAKNWNAPEYAVESVVYVPEPGMKKQKPVQEAQIFVAVLRIGENRIVGDATFGVVHAKANAARKALEQNGQLHHIGGNDEVFRELRSFCQSQGLGEPTFTLRFGNSIPDRVPIVPAHASQCVQVNGNHRNRDLFPDNGGYVRGRRDRAAWRSEELPENDLGCSRIEGSETFVASHQYSRRAMQVNNTQRYYQRNTNANGRARMHVQRSCRLPAVVWH